MSEKDVPTPDVTDGKTDEVAAKLAEFGANDEVVSKVKDLGVETVEDLASLNEADLVGAGVKVVQARKLLNAVAPPPAAPAADTVADTSAAIASILPQVPNYESLLDMLRTGGVLKIDRSSVTAAVQAWNANRAGLFELPQRLANEILAFAKRNDEPVDAAVYYRLKNQLTRVRYGDLFAAIEGFDGRSVTAANKKELFENVEKSLLPALREFHEVLVNWHEAWVASSNNPVAFQAALARLAGGQSAGVMPSLGAVADTNVLRDQADKVNDAANRVFSGEGVQVAAAVAFESGKIRETLQDPSLPAKIGAANHEQMLKQLGVAVSSADPRLESNLVQYVLAILQVKNVAGGNDELLYFDALWQLGGLIPWNQFGGRGAGRFTRLGD